MIPLNGLNKRLQSARELFLSVYLKVCVRRWHDEISCKTTDPARGHTQTQTGIYKKHTHCADSGTFQTTVGQEREGQELIICSLGTGNSCTEETILTPTMYRCLASPLNSTSNICFWEFECQIWCGPWQRHSTDSCDLRTPSVTNSNAFVLKCIIAVWQVMYKITQGSLRHN